MASKYCVRWIGYNQDITSSLWNLYKDGILVDSVLDCHGIEYTAHSLILTAGFSKVSEMLTTTDTGKRKYTVPPDVTPEDLQSLLEFVYRGETVLHPNQISSFPWSAELMGVNCQATIVESITEIQEDKGIDVEHSTESTDIQQFVEDVGTSKITEGGEEEEDSKQEEEFFDTLDELGSYETISRNSEESKFSSQLEVLKKKFDDSDEISKHFGKDFSKKLEEMKKKLEEDTERMVVFLESWEVQQIHCSKVKCQLNKENFDYDKKCWELQTSLQLAFTRIQEKRKSRRKLTREPKKINTKSRMKAKVITGKKVDRSESLLCYECGLLHSSVKARKTHWRLKHVAKKATMSVVCEQCGKTLRGMRNLKWHIQRVHRYKNEAEYPFGCSVCSRRFCERRVLTNHMRIHTRVNSVTCCICNKICESTRSLHIHLAATHSIPFQGQTFHCNQCDSTLYHPRLFLDHKKQHNKPLSCPICCKKFADKGSMLSHQLCHYNMFAFKCPYCERNFKLKQKFFQHVRKSHSSFPQPDVFHCMYCTHYNTTRGTELLSHICSVHAK